MGSHQGVACIWYHHFHGPKQPPPAAALAAVTRWRLSRRLPGAGHGRDGLLAAQAQRRKGVGRAQGLGKAMGGPGP